MSLRLCRGNFYCEIAITKQTYPVLKCLVCKKKLYKLQINPQKFEEYCVYPDIMQWAIRKRINDEGRNYLEDFIHVGTICSQSSLMSTGGYQTSADRLNILMRQCWNMSLNIWVNVILGLFDWRYSKYSKYLIFSYSNSGFDMPEFWEKASWALNSHGEFLFTIMVRLVMRLKKSIN